MLFTRWASICLLHDRLIMLLFYAFFNTWKALFSMAFYTLLSLLLFSMLSLMLIGQDIPLIAGPPLVIAFFLVLLWFLSEAKNKPLWPVLVLKQNIVPLLIPHLSSFGYNGFLRTDVFTSSVLLLFIMTTRVPFILLTMMSSINGRNISRSIVILSVIILSIVLSSCSRSPLKINLRISSPSHILRDTFVLWLTTQVGLTLTLSLRGAINV